MLTAIARALIGRPVEVPAELVRAWPELAEARFRRGGLPIRVAGWCLGQATAAGFTLWRVVWLAPTVPLDPGLLLHEVRHVQQFQSHPAFPLRYLWESVRRGYVNNSYEADARAYARRRLGERPAAGDADAGRGDE